jgi:SAM-dependent MidA family methyltransferase
VPLSERLRERIRVTGPVRFDDFVELALYDAHGGFYSGEAGAGRSRDFLTSPEVGPLFGAVLARAIDAWWVEAGEPERWTVVDAGAGPGTLLRSVLAAEPRCAGVIEPIAVDRSAAQRKRTPDGVTTRADLPAAAMTGVVVANELLDNVPWRLLERGASGWTEVWVDLDSNGELIERLEAASEDVENRAHDLAPSAPVGARIPLQDRAAEWLRRALAIVERGRVLVLDYSSLTDDMARRPVGEWLRTYRGHQRGGRPLDGAGTQDVTVEVAVDQLHAAAVPNERRSQRDFLIAYGIGELVAEGRRVWTERAHLGDLEALTARSRISEAEALTDPVGLGGFSVLEWSRQSDR